MPNLNFADLIKNTTSTTNRNTKNVANKLRILSYFLISNSMAHFKENVSKTQMFFMLPAICTGGGL